jgi:hypothetical protein
METQSDTLKEVLSELFALLEAQETSGAALLQLLKDQGIASDEKLSTYLDQAGRASNVKWRAARMRMEYLLTPIQKETADKDKSKQAEPKEAQSKEAQSSEVANKEEEGKRKNQAKDNGNEKEEKPAETKSAGNDNAEKSPDERSGASKGITTKDQATSRKQTA